MIRALLSRVPIAAGVLAAAALSGCIEAEQAITLNPDRSGRIDLTLTTAMNPAMLGGLAEGFGGDSPGEAPDPAEMEREFAEGMTESITGASEGIEAWTKPVVKTLEDGRMRVALTGYFPDINKVRLGGALGGDEGSAESGAAESGAEADRPDPVLAVEPAGDGRMRIRFVTFESAAQLDLGGGLSGPDGADDAVDASSLSGEALKAKVLEERQAWQFAKGMMQGFLGGLKFSTAVKVPGTIAKSHNLEIEGDDVASNSITGTKLIAIFDKVHMDDELAAKAMKASPTGDLMDGIGALSAEEFDVHEALFGKPGIPEVTVEVADQPLFDYEAAVERARQQGGSAAAE